MPRKTTKTQALVPLKPQSTAVLQKVFENVPREDIVAALIDSGDPRAISLAERLSDVAHSRTSLATHCLEVKMLPKDVWNILIDSRKLEARLRLSDSLTAIIASVADAALPQIIACPMGCVDGKIGEDACKMCQGAGSVIKAPDKEMLKMALEIGELINVKVPLVAQQFNSYGKSASPQQSSMPDMTDWSKQSDAAFVDATEAEIVK